jgi:DHH family protein
MNYKELLIKIITEIEKANSIVILRHRKPDPDALGSQIGLSKLIKRHILKSLFMLLEICPKT